MTRINAKQPQSMGIQRESLLDTSNEIEGSFNSERDLAEKVILSPLKALNMMKGKTNSIQQDSHDQSMH